MAKQWGTPIWNFFHCLAEHVNGDFYKHNKGTFKQFISLICNNLPCNECTKHATQYIKFNMTDNKIIDKERFKMFFFDFHNDVNRRKGKPIFTDYDKYKSMNLIDAYNTFKHEYTRNTNLNRGFCDRLQRNNLIISLQKFLSNNWQNFKWNA